MPMVLHAGADRQRGHRSESQRPQNATICARTQKDPTVGHQPVDRAYRCLLANVERGCQPKALGYVRIEKDKGAIAGPAALAARVISVWAEAEMAVIKAIESSLRRIRRCRDCRWTLSGWPWRLPQHRLDCSRECACRTCAVAVAANMEAARTASRSAETTTWAMGVSARPARDENRNIVSLCKPKLRNRLDQPLAGEFDRYRAKSGGNWSRLDRGDISGSNNDTGRKRDPSDAVCRASLPAGLNTSRSCFASRP